MQSAGRSRQSPRNTSLGAATIRYRPASTAPGAKLSPAEMSGGWGMVGPRGVRVRRVAHGRLPWNQVEIRRPIAGSHPCPGPCHQGRWLPRPFSRAAALDSRPSCSGGFLQGLDERREGPGPLDPAELALGARQASLAPALMHVPVPPARHPRRDPPRHREGRLDGIGRFQAVPPPSSREKPRPVERPDGRNHPLHFSTQIGTTSL
jgi:hypothetical protein